MAVPDSGALTFKGLHNEKVSNNYSSATDPSGPVSLKDLSTSGNSGGSTVSYAATNSNSTDKPDGNAPYSMSEFYSYDHDGVGVPAAPTGMSYNATSTTLIAFIVPEPTNSTQLGMFFTAGAQNGNPIFVDNDADGLVSVDGTGNTVFAIGGGNDRFADNSVVSISANSSFTVKFKAKNGTGFSAFSSNITGYALPGTPTNLGASSITTTTATLSWTAPSGGASSYKVYYGLDGQDMTSDSVYVTTTSTSINVTGLDSDESYYLFVAAVGGGGDTGAYSSGYGFTTLEPTSILSQRHISGTTYTNDSAHTNTHASTQSPITQTIYQTAFRFRISAGSGNNSVVGNNTFFNMKTSTSSAPSTSGTYTTSTTAQTVGSGIYAYVRTRCSPNMNQSHATYTENCTITCTNNGVSDTYVQTFQYTIQFGKSDRRLKTDIKQINTSPSGIPIYEFRFKDSLEQKWEGVIAQDLIEMGYKDDIVRLQDNYYHVDYSKIDVDQIQIIGE